MLTFGAGCADRIRPGSGVPGTRLPKRPAAGAARPVTPSGRGSPGIAPAAQLHGIRCAVDPLLGPEIPRPAAPTPLRVHSPASLFLDSLPPAAQALMALGLTVPTGQGILRASHRQSRR